MANSYMMHLISQMLSESSGTKSNESAEQSHHSQKIYDEEPLLCRASQLKMPNENRRIWEMQRLGNNFRISVEAIFYEQAKFMEDYTDSYKKIVHFSSYYPTYRDMSVPQLRCYFTWRTKVRQGQIVPIAFSYAYVYLYELLHLIGVQTPQEGYDVFTQFCRHFAPENLGFLQNTQRWQHDYIIYYGLDSTLLPCVDGVSPEWDRAQISLMHTSDQSAETLLQNIATVSSYPILQSKCYNAYPKQMTQVIYHVYRGMEAHFQKQCKQSFSDYLFGKCTQTPYHMFENAIFWRQFRPKTRTYSVNAIRHYHCTNGTWTCEKYPNAIRAKKRLGDIIQMIDEKMRIAYQIPNHSVVSNSLPKYQTEIIDKEIWALQEKEKQLERTYVAFDLSKLQYIRQTADNTRDKLLTEEELHENDLLEAPSPPDFAALPENTSQTTITGLSAMEQIFLRCLLTGESYQAALQSVHAMPSLLADHINEILFDTFGDTVIVFNGDAPEIMEDYREDLKGMFLS